MKLQCNKYDFTSMVIACNESTSCFSCVFRDYCRDLNKDKGEFIADIAEIVEGGEVEHDQS